MAINVGSMGLDFSYYALYIHYHISNKKTIGLEATSMT